MKREKIELNGMVFKFKKDLYEYTQSLINQKGLCDITNTDKDFNFFIDLFFRKPCNKIYRGKVKAFKITRNPITLKIGHMFWIDYYDKEQTFSWNKCVNGRDDDTYNFKLNSACRVSIKEQREECWYNFDKCNKCNKTKINREFEIDHDNIDFCNIVEEFDNTWTGKKPTKFKKEPTTCQYIFSDEDKLYKDMFQEFHMLKANLQLLCKECHADKTYSK